MPLPPVYDCVAFMLDADQVLDAVLQALDEGVLVFDDRGVCTAAGRRAGELLGIEPSAIVGLARAEVLARFSAAVEAPAVLAPLGAPADRTVVDPIIIPKPVTMVGDPPSRPALRTVVWTSVPRNGGGRIDLIRDVTPSAAPR